MFYIYMIIYVLYELQMFYASQPAGYTKMVLRWSLVDLQCSRGSHQGPGFGFCLVPSGNQFKKWNIYPFLIIEVNGINGIGVFFLSVDAVNISGQGDISREWCASPADHQNMGNISGRCNIAPLSRSSLWEASALVNTLMFPMKLYTFPLKNSQKLVMNQPTYPSFGSPSCRFFESVWIQTILPITSATEEETPQHLTQ